MRRTRGKDKQRTRGKDKQTWMIKQPLYSNQNGIGTSEPNFVDSLPSTSQQVDEDTNREISKLSRDLITKPRFDEVTENYQAEEQKVEDEDGNGVNEDSRSGSIATEGVDDIAKLLEEVQLGMEEPVLSEDQLMTNDQRQEDELLALESIYGDNAFILDRQRGLRYFQIYIHVEVPDQITITAKPNSLSDHRTKIDGPDDFSLSLNVQYLPPIVLACLLPKSYPSHQPPYFTISVQWLNAINISRLCSGLDLIWMELPGQEIIYHWVEWLHSSALSHLGFDKEVILGPYGIKCTDKRAISGSVSPDVDVPKMRAFNDDKSYENFCNNLHECCICLSEYAGTEFIRLPCQHFFCWNCMKTYSDMHVKEGTINKLHCPDTKCGGMVPPSLLKRLLGDEEFEHWESLMIQKTLDSMSDVVYCPRCETPCIEDEDQHTQCSKCFFSFCTLCREKRHVGISCMTPEMKLQLLQERQNLSHLNENQRGRERELINDILSIKEVLRDAKQCPSCKMAISRTEGCNKMVCKNCGQYFCYNCNKAIDGYDHFRGDGCVLLTQNMIRDWERNNANIRQVVGQVHAELFAEHGQPCPNCRQLNAKIGNNNHIFCWACQNHYCYVCRKMVSRSSQHFGPKGCKQHTVG